MKITAVLVCLTLGPVTAPAQYKAIVATPTPPAATSTGTGDVYAGVELRAFGGGYAWGVYQGRAVKVSLIDGSLTMLESNAPPSPFDYSAALASDGTQAIGYSGGTTRTCVRWDANLVATKYTSSSFQQSACNATDGTLLGGFLENDSLSGGTMTPSSQRATLWTSPTTLLDLHTGGNNFSQVLGMSGNQQVGFQSPSLVFGMTGNRFFGGQYPTLPGAASAYLWHGSTSGAVNLNPPGFSSSLAFATNGVQQGGYAYDTASPARRHAILWSGTAASGLDLNPAGWSDTEIRALSAAAQAGDGYEPQNRQLTPGIRHALVWFGSAASMVDLNQYLPLGFTDAVADAIDSSGNVAGHAWMQTPTGFTFAPVIFEPQPATPWQLLSVTLNQTEINSGDAVTGQVTLAGPAPEGGQAITLYPCSIYGLDLTNLEPVPTTVLVPEGQISAPFSFVANRFYLTYPTILNPGPMNFGGQMETRIYANDGVVSRFASLSVDLFPFLRSLTIPTPIQGGATATGSLLISATPWPSGIANIALTSGNPSVLGVPATATVLQGANVPNASFTVTTSPVAAATVVPVTASINGTSITVNVTVTPAPPVALSGLSVTQELVGGTPYHATVSFSGPVPFGGATVALSSDNPAVVPVPATVSAAQGQTSIAFSAVTATVTSSITAHITATYNGVSLTAPVTVNNDPPLKITVAEYDTISLVAKISATTTVPNSILSYGFDPAQGPLGTMSVNNGVWSVSVKNLAAAPALITVWSSNGGSVSVAPTLRNK